MLKFFNKPELEEEEEEKEIVTPKPEKEEVKDNQPTWQELAGVDPKDFDSPEKLAKSYKDATKGLSDQGQKLKAAEDFKTSVTPLLKAVYGNPDLYKKVVEEVKTLYGEIKDGDDKEEKNTPDPKVDELSGLEEQRIIDKIEENNSFLREKTDEEKTKIRKEVGQIMTRWLGAGQKPSLSQLGPMLKDAWSIWKNEHNVEEEKEEPISLSGFGTPRSVQAAIGKMGVSSLSPQEIKAAERMGLTAEEYLGQKKEIMTPNN